MGIALKIFSPATLVNVSIWNFSYNVSPFSTSNINWGKSFTGFIRCSVVDACLHPRNSFCYVKTMLPKDHHSLFTHQKDICNWYRIGIVMLWPTWMKDFEYNNSHGILASFLLLRRIIFAIIRELKRIWTGIGFWVWVRLQLSSVVVPWVEDRV